MVFPVGHRNFTEMTKMKVLIAGATGLIGKELVKQCLEKGMEINYLTTRESKLEQRENYRGFYWDPSSNIIDPEAFDRVSTIINLAGAPVSKRWTSSYKKTILDSRIKSTNLLYSSLKGIDHMVEQYISASGISIYPSSTDHLYSEEHSKASDSFLGKVTEAWEQAAEKFSFLGIQVAKVRTGIVLASNEGALPQIVKPVKNNLGAPLGSGDQWQSWIHLEDMANIYVWLLQHRKSGIYNAVAPGPVTNKKLTRVIAEELDRSLWLPNVPKFMLRLLLGEMADLVLESQLVSAQKLEAENFRFHYVNLEKAIEDLL